MVTVKIVPNDKGSPPGKLADAELHFQVTPAKVSIEELDQTAEALDGLKLIGFGIWERRGGGRNVTFPARQYSINGERRSFALLRPIAYDAGNAASERIRDLILAAYAEHEDQTTAA